MKKTFFIFLIILIYSCRKEENDVNYERKIIPDNFDFFTIAKKNNYLKSLSDSISNLNNDSLKIKYLFDVSNQSYYLKNYELSIITSKNAYSTSLIIKDSLNLGRALYYIGDCYLDYQKDSAYYYYKESEKIFRKINNHDRLAKVLYNKAYLLYYEGNYVESEIEVIKALNHLKNGKNLLYQYRCYSLQGSNLLELEEYNKAIEYFDLSASTLKQMIKNNLEKDAFYDYEIANTVDLCNAYDKKGEYFKSINLLQEVITTKNISEYPNLEHIVYGNLAYSLMKNKNYAPSKKNYIKAINICKRNNDNLSYLYLILDFGEYHLLTKDTIKSKELFEEALLLSKQLNNGKEILKSLDFLSIADKSNASNYKTEYIRINDSIVKKQRENREKFTRIEYETDKVEEENKILSNKNLLLLSGLSLSIAVFLIILIIRNRISRRKELYLIQQKELADEELFNLTKEFQTSLVKAKEAEQKKLSKELHDGIVNKIYGIRMMLGSLNAKSDETSKFERLGYIKELHKLESEVRDLSHNLNADFSKYVGEFNFLLEQLVQNNNTIGNTQFISEISSTIDWNMYSSVVKINIYRILQELLQNVTKYAIAQKCYVTITEHKDYLIVEVQDDGIGFNVNSLSKGIGLKNIRERAKSINSEIEIKSNTNEGTTISLKAKIGSL